MRLVFRIVGRRSGRLNSFVNYFLLSSLNTSVAICLTVSVVIGGFLSASKVICSRLIISAFMLIPDLDAASNKSSFGVHY